ncbi:MAG: hypothetical protein QS98_C0008G0033 [archaeon GW2011_AR3]|nr:MAG: hypothetical protein QS98_C0008G0033 [archaeon GW2011_AR3]
MKIKTKLWKRSPTSFATTVPQIAILPLDEGKKYDILWEYDRKNDIWKVRFEERKKEEAKKKVKGNG